MVIDIGKTPVNAKTIGYWGTGYSHSLNVPTQKLLLITKWKKKPLKWGNLVDTTPFKLNKVSTNETTDQVAPNITHRGHITHVVFLQKILT